MQRAALYARVSTERQEKEETIESQLAAITRYADLHGLRHTSALTYIDDGYSGSWLDRPALDELRDHAREGRFDVVVVLCPDRLARRYAYQVLLLEELKRAGVEIEFCERPIGDTPDDQLLLQIQGAIAEYERAKILERCRRGRLHRARQGELAPPTTPYGYTYAARKYGGDGKIRIDADEAAMVRQVFRWYAEEGVTLNELLRRLNASPWKTRWGKKEWCFGSVRAMLRCEWYVGRAYYNRQGCRLRERSGDDSRSKTVRYTKPRSEWIPVSVPRLVDDETFTRVQQRIEENRRFARRRLKRQAYLLRGLLKCGVCGHAYIGYTQVVRSRIEPTVAEYPYYVCSLRNPLRAGKATRCTSGRLMAAGVDKIVWTTVRDLLLDDGALAEELDAWLKRETADPKEAKRVQLAAVRLKELRQQRERLIDAYQTGALDLDDFRSRKTAIEDRTLAVEHEQAELRSRAARRGLAARQAAGAAAVAARLREQLHDPTFEIKQAILRLVVDKVVATGHRLEIHLALPVSGGFDLTSAWRARPYSPHNKASSA